MKRRWKDQTHVGAVETRHVSPGQQLKCSKRRWRCSATRGRTVGRGARTVAVAALVSPVSFAHLVSSRSVDSGSTRLYALLLVKALAWSSSRLRKRARTEPDYARGQLDSTSGVGVEGFTRNLCSHRTFPCTALSLLNCSTRNASLSSYSVQIQWWFYYLEPLAHFLFASCLFWRLFTTMYNYV